MLRSFRSHVVCFVSFRECPQCLKRFCCKAASRRKFCTDMCTALAWVARSGGRYSVTAALEHMKRQRVYRDQRRSYHDEVVLQRHVPIAAQTPTPSSVRNTHVPGSIAFALLYGDRRQTFSRGDGQFVGRGNHSKRAISRGGVSV